ncbi:YbjN domain-containing protein [Sediminicola luteus]|jgi:hypothetical protein|uniref:Molecular chaperone Tir n=1 Tax=Sediminicola luteus TaxID=319238 RepID=A0A2A4G905_9FLAO|nr:YbjN domain-containing protein [Sediminicola luteus]PCE64252.1 molecular chaperone Tir [Sediminicola luteus]
MKNHFQVLKGFLLELDYTISYENPEEGILRIDKEHEGITNMIIGCAYPIVIMEQFICELGHTHGDVYKKLLQKNRDIIHGAFVLDEKGSGVIFRDTLQLGSLDKNEIEASLNSLSLLLSEYSTEIIAFSKK